DDLFDDRETETSARDCVGDGVRSAEETLEQAPLLGLRDADPGIADLERDRLWDGSDANGHPSAGGRELERIREEVVEHPPERFAIGAHEGRLLHLEQQLDSSLVRERAQRVD